MDTEDSNFEARFRLLENCLIEVLSEVALKLAHASEAGVFLLIESPDGGRRLHGSPGLCHAFLHHELGPNGTETRDDFDVVDEETLTARAGESIIIESHSVGQQRQHPVETIPLVELGASVSSPLGKRKMGSSGSRHSASYKARRLTPVKSEHSSKSDVILAENVVVDVEPRGVDNAGVDEGGGVALSDAFPGIVLKEEYDADSIRQLLVSFLASSTKAEAIQNSADPTIFSKNSIMYKVLSSLIWDYSKECVKLMPMDEKSKPSFSAFAFDLLWKFFPAFDVYDGNTPSINTGGCYRSPRGFFKNMFWNRLKDHTTRRKR